MRYSQHLCQRYQHAIEIVGKRWTGLILKVLLERPLRFNEIAAQIGVVSDRMLSERLKELETEGIIERRVFPETPVRVEYRLSPKGQALAPVITELHTWAAEWIDLDTVVPSAECD